MHTSSTLTAADRWDHMQVRWGFRRGAHRVLPGLYTLGNPNPQSPVFVTANYTLSFDALRSALNGIAGYILVLDTHGINVWCAAGKGSFGTDELVSRIESTRLSSVVRHRSLILPQLGAPGVAAHEVKQRSGFTVEYGPVRAADLPAYLKSGRATPQMRRVTFPLRDRMALIPVELVHAALPTVAAAVILGLIAGPWAAVGVAAAVLAGVVLFPILLPWLPTRDFSSKGFILGVLVALALGLLQLTAATAAWIGIGTALAFLLAMPAATAYLALNFTGATPFTSRSGVKREMAAYIPWMARAFISGIVLTLAIAILQRVL